MRTSRIILFLLLNLTLSARGFSQLPETILRNTVGEMINTSKLGNDGHPYVVVFFALWCKPCLRELQAISEVYEEWQIETGVKIYAVSIDEGQNSEKVAPFVSGNGWNYEVLADNNREFMQKMNVTLIPCLFIVDGNNKIVYRKNGYTDGSETELLNEIRKYSVKK